MKTMFLTLTLVFAGLSAQAAPTTDCAFKLDEEAYWDNGSGVLTIDGEQTRCESTFDEEGTQHIDCAPTQRGNLRVSFDGAEANFFVWETGFEEPICEGIATSPEYP